MHILECNCASGLDLEKENFVAIIILPALVHSRSFRLQFAFCSLQFADCSSQFAHQLDTLPSLSHRVPFCAALIICSPSSQIKNMPKQIKCIQCVYIYRCPYRSTAFRPTLGMHFVSMGNCALVRTVQGAFGTGITNRKEMSSKYFGYKFISNFKQ